MPNRITLKGMNLMAAISSCCLLAMACTAGAAVPLACNLKAIGPAERPRYNELVKRLRAAVEERSELSDGYRYQLNEKTITVPEMAEWIAMERLCCPFLDFRLEVAGKGGSSLTLRGPAGAKAILEEEFPAPK